MPTCADCQAWLYDPDRGWQKTERRGMPDGIPRPPGTPTPCQKCPKAGSKEPYPHPEKELSAKNLQAWWYYLQCQADDTRLLPRDRVVVRNNALIRLVCDQARQANADPLRLFPLFLTAKKR